ncbi:hypothetical protein KCG48_04925 [Proteiniclasticum sp. BAD-10]|uniref:Uncharacterized protein n=1 Tax=Proteiniclasticum sediminis TaxID=2804028 RepID=A0A941HQN8_9CLOT|nr:hypothetical protein [Proteiniclasticum sediminis]MBR0575683.1 hypothetical protein [Proteiniclasticum sediminis]
MVKDILTAAGVQYKEVRFLQPPAGTYAVYFDAVSARGSDSTILILEHTSTIELYSPNIDTDAEAKIEFELFLRAMEFGKQDRTWLKDEQIYMTVYTFDYIEKRR